MNRPAPSPFRSLWALRPGTIFLNHGSFGACPHPLLNRQADLRLQMEADPVQFLWRHYEERLETARARLARFLGANEHDLVFVTNTTTAINAVVRSLELAPGDELLTTCCDYNACRNVLIEAARRSGARVAVAPVPFPVASPAAVIESVLSALTPRTRLAMIDHVTSDTALVFPIEDLIRELKIRGVETLIDGAHAPGMLDLDLPALAPAFYAGNLHKWVCAPKGSAFLWAREDVQDQLQPAVISHGNNRARPGFTPFQDRFDWAGTLDPTPWFVSGEAIDWMGSILPGGWPELRERNHSLAADARQLLCKRWEMEPPSPEAMLGAMATVPLPERFQGPADPDRIDPWQRLLHDQFGIEVPWIRIGGRRHLRISAQIYNTLEEYEFLAEAMEVLATSPPRSR